MSAHNTGDRSSELVQYANLLHQRVISGRMKLRPHVNTNSAPKISESSLFHTQFLPIMKQAAASLTISLDNFKQLLSLAETYDSADRQQRQELSKETAVLTNRLNSEVVSINNLLQRTLKLTPNVLREFSGRPQICQHVKNITSISEYRLAKLSMQLRDVLKNKHYLFEPKQMREEEDGPPIFTLGNGSALFRPVSQHQAPYPNNPQQPTSYMPVPPNSGSLNAGAPNYHPRARNQHTNLWTPHPYPPSLSNQYPSKPSTFIPSQTPPVDEQLRGGGDMFAPQEQMQQQQQGMLVRQRDSTAIRSTEATIVQLGEIYQQFSFLVKEQGELVTRIDANLEDAGLNVEIAHSELTEFFRTISSRRGFMLKFFAVLLLCFCFFAFFLR